jgi:hypothetical protein
MAIDKTAMRAAFNAGWAAACMTIADEITRAGGADLAPMFREMAGSPAPVEIGDLSTPEGQAMRRGSEVVFHQRVSDAPAALPQSTERNDHE